MRVPDHIDVDEDAESCPWCELRYSAFRTGETFASVRSRLWVNSGDSNDWIYKRRNTVLGLWRQIKREMWVEHMVMCAGLAELEEEERGHDEDQAEAPTGASNAASAT